MTTKKDETPAGFEMQEVDISEEGDIRAETPKQSEVTEEENEQNLAEYEKTMGKSIAKAQISKVLKTEDEPEGPEAEIDTADEFVRNFFIKYGMKKTLDSFQRVWFKLKTENKIQPSELPKVPEVYQENQRLHDELAFLQKELDTAKINADKAETTGKKLCKQRDLKKIQHRRIQQEKDRLSKEHEQKIITELEQQKQQLQKQASNRPPSHHTYNSCTCHTQYWDRQ